MLHMQGGTVLPWWFASHSTRIQATQFTSSLFRPESCFATWQAPDRMSHACFFFCLCFFVQELFPSGHNRIKARLMDCCSDACLCGGFTHVCRGTLRLLVLGHLPGKGPCCLVTEFDQTFERFWRSCWLLKSNIFQRCGFLDTWKLKNMPFLGLWWCMDWMS